MVDSMFETKFKVIIRTDEEKEVRKLLKFYPTVEIRVKIPYNLNGLQAKTIIEGKFYTEKSKIHYKEREIPYEIHGDEIILSKYIGLGEGVFDIMLELARKVKETLKQVSEQKENQKLLEEVKEQENIGTIRDIFRELEIPIM